MRQATHQKHGQSPQVGNGGQQMSGNMMQNVSNGQMHNGMEQQLQQQQQMMQQQQATYDVLDNAGYCSPSNGELMVILIVASDRFLIHILLQVNNHRTRR